MRRSHVDRRASRRPAVQCLSDTGHKDADMKGPEFYEKQEIDCYLHNIKAYVVKSTTGGFGASGHADRLACINGTFWAIEVKRQGKKPTALQQTRMNEVRAAGGMAVAGTAEVVIAAIEEWRNQELPYFETVRELMDHRGRK